MAYYTGSAVDLAAVRTALTNACVAEGWTWNSSTEMLSKGTLFLRIQVASGYLALLGRTSASAGDAPTLVRIGPIASVPLVFPMTYEIFVFTNEVYLVLNYGVEYYQWCAFGKSVVKGLPGTGMWLGASQGGVSPSVLIGIADSAGGVGYGTTTGALFWATLQISESNCNCWVHSDLDGQGWLPAQTASQEALGIAHLNPLMKLLPNAWNSEAVLLPLRYYKLRPSSKYSLTADLEHARCTRIDNYSPGQILAIGSDRWKIFPWYRKDTTARNGGNGIGHTGTFGWAIRYEGP